LEVKTFLSAMLAIVTCFVIATVSRAEEAAPKKLEPHRVRDTVSLVLTRESAAKTPEERAAAVRDLSTLYLALARDTDMAREPKLKLKAKMYSRLISIKQDLEHDLERRKESGKYPVIVAPPCAAVHDNATTDKTEPSSANAPSTSATSTAAAEPQGGGAVRDYGETLVELIQHTISPEHWDVVGGPGSIVYWPNLQVLVVRASGDAHGRVGGLFDGLRAAK
jgi:hypothetical protein